MPYLLRHRSHVLLRFIQRTHPFSRLVRQVRDILTKYLLDEDGIFQSKQIQRRPFACEYNMWYTDKSTISGNEQFLKNNLDFQLQVYMQYKLLVPDKKKCKNENLGQKLFLTRRLLFMCFLCNSAVTNFNLNSSRVHSLPVEMLNAPFKVKLGYMGFPWTN